MIGSTVSHYRIVDRLGGGGMGVVYKAVDVKLDRAVALKFLASQRGASEEARRRFLREARAASAIDHPNICTVHEIDETADGALFIAMALCEGETLRDRIARGPLAVPEAIGIAEQIAAGLAAAHERGIVHRDVKPGNVMVAPGGRVKIVDFGLAKLANQSRITHAGTVMGTVVYMSPEQIRGQDTDSRTDVWSLGAVIYEMVTGRPPFGGGSAAEGVRAILKQPPSPMALLRPGVPPALERVVARALAKSPEARYAGMSALRAELLSLAPAHAEAPPMQSGPPPGHSISSLPTGSVAAVERRARDTRPARREIAIRAGSALAAIAAIVALVAGTYRWARASIPRPALFQPTVSRLTDPEGTDSFPSLSPDGQYFAFMRESPSGNQHIYRQRIGGSNPTDLTADSPEGDTQPAFSPDGKQIAFRSERNGGGIFLMGATGESAHRLTDFGFEPAWSPDGKEIAVSTTSIWDPRIRTVVGQIWLVDAVTGEKRLLPTGMDSVQPSWSPDGSRIAYWGRSQDGSRRVIWTIPVPGGQAVPVTHDSFINWSPTWSPDGRYLYFTSDRGGSMNLWRVAVAEATGEVLGEPEPITTPDPWSSGLRFSQDGKRAIYSTRYNKANIERAGLDPAVPAVTGPLKPITQGSREVSFGRVSPDGRRIVFSSKSPQEDLFLVGTDGSGLRQLTNDAFKDRNPGWSSDGRRILFYSDRSGRYEAWSIRPDGSELQQVTRTRGEPIFYPLESPDSRRLVCGLGFTGPALIDLTRPIGERAPERLPPAPAKAPLFASSWSPDGTRLAGGAGNRLFLFSLSARRYEPLDLPGLQPIWLRDGFRLVYLSAGQIYLVDTRTKQPRRLLSPPVGSMFVGVDLGPDDRALYVVHAQEEGAIWMLTMR